jgi:hypothetical protein
MSFHIKSDFLEALQLLESNEVAEEDNKASTNQLYVRDIFSQALEQA